MVHHLKSKKFQSSPLHKTHLQDPFFPFYTSRGVNVWNKPVLVVLNDHSWGEGKLTAKDRLTV